MTWRPYVPRTRFAAYRATGVNAPADLHAVMRKTRLPYYNSVQALERAGLKKLEGRPKR